MTAFAIILGFALFASAIVYAGRAFSQRPAPPEQIFERFDDADIRSILIEHEDEFRRITAQMEEASAYWKRTQNRINATVGRARKELLDHGFEAPGVEAEFDELRLVDGDGGEESGLPAVPEQVGPFSHEGIPGEGVTSEQLLKARGYA